MDWPPEWKPVSKPEMIGWLVFYAFTFWMYRPSGWHYLDSVHLVMHEAGHPVFGALGNETLMVMGGTLMQLLVPAGLAISFASRGLTTGAAFCAFMFFNSFINVGIYMADAQAMDLPLVTLGGGDGGVAEHDWRYLFEKWHFIYHDVAIGRCTETVGYLGMIGVALWLVWMWRKSEENV